MSTQSTVEWTLQIINNNKYSAKLRLTFYFFFSSNVIFPLFIKIGGRIILEFLMNWGSFFNQCLKCINRWSMSWSILSLAEFNECLDIWDSLMWFMETWVIFKPSQWCFLWYKYMYHSSYMRLLLDCRRRFRDFISPLRFASEEKYFSTVGAPLTWKSLHFTLML